MIGQEELLQSIDRQIKENTFPRFAIIVGDKGSGRKTLADYIGTSMSAQIIKVGVSIDEIRSVIKNAYKDTEKTLYIIADADKMSKQAQNAMLKVVEEPPNNSYFLITLEDEYNTLETIRSRGSIFSMQYYTPEQLLKVDYEMTKEVKDIIIDVCSTPGEVIELIKIGPTLFYDYVEKVVDNIAEVSGANSFKIAEKINLKDSPEKFNLKMFWKAFVSICGKRGKKNKEERLPYYEAVRITSRYIQDLGIRGINKSGLFDLWILDIRKAWM